ncbi:hypothetical protein AXF42_Ash007592 [Apostasia shenzhenica]|uniref:Arabinogalactan peptide 16 n=1 Tax=Apostasia shenzhenica TaxID=1088818 RepID=A0A2I0A5Y0_9ASPA|nr:hypothetical protein AXF42_Ash007592 [Apostasia shenzhenica]
MAISRVYAFIFAAFFLSGLMQIAQGEVTSKLSRMVDKKTIDLGIAYVLMLLALLVTYVAH